jgi:D-beta-D-heptose 7-phosphate kinase/D-beta-D-heptose 1-phosphate adenosyltransferase
MENLFTHIDSDERSRRLFSVAGKVYRDSILLSSLNPEERIIESLEDLDDLTRMFKLWGAEVVLTMGSFDLFHVGHARYIRKARQHGSLLIVGVEDDKKARGRKGENRPAVPYVERSELVTYLRYADLIAVKSHDQEKWAMIKTVKPDTLIATKGTYVDEEVEALKEFCGKIVVLERQAETSTSAQIRRMALDGADNFKRAMTEGLPDYVTSVYEKMKKGV